MVTLEDIREARRKVDGVIRRTPVVGKSAADAQKTLEAAGFSVTIKLAKSPKQPGTVLTESPNAGATLEAGSIITLTVSGTPAPAPSPSPSATPS